MFRIMFQLNIAQVRCNSEHHPLHRLNDEKNIQRRESVILGRIMSEIMLMRRKNFTASCWQLKKALNVRK